LKQRLVLWLAYLFALTVAFVACGSGGGGSSGNGNPGNGGKTDDIYKQYPDLPPDPGEAGKATLEGIDSNKNGVRDDVEIAIYEFAPRPDQETQRQALTQAAKGFQLSVLAGDKNDTEAALEVSETLSKAMRCVRQQYADNSARTAATLLETTIANADERLFAYWRYNELLSGRIFESVDDPSPCDYDKSKP
jgi:hypothetical protein